MKSQNPAIIGVGRTRFGEHYEEDPESLIEEAGLQALDSAGITRKDLDACYLSDYFLQVTNKIGLEEGFFSELIAVMGCIVNGPGEMADADFGYVGSGPGVVNLYVGHECVERRVPEDQADDRLVDLIRDHGIERMVFSSTCATYGIPAAVPVGEGIGKQGADRAGPQNEAAVGSDQAFPCTHDLRGLFTSCLHGTLDDPQLRLTIRARTEAVQPHIQNIKGRIRGMYLKSLSLSQVGDSEENLSGLEVQFHIIQVSAGELKDIHLGLPVHAEIVLLPEVDSGSAVVQRFDRDGGRFVRRVHPVDHGARRGRLSQGDVRQRAPVRLVPRLRLHRWGI